MLSHTVVKGFYDFFPASRLTFNYGFALDVCQMVFEILQGIPVSVSYIKTQVHKFFKSDPFAFLHASEESKARSNSLPKVKSSNSLLKKIPTIGKNRINIRREDSISKEEFKESIRKVYNEDKIKSIIEDKNNIIKVWKALKNKNQYLRSKKQLLENQNHLAVHKLKNLRIKPTRVSLVGSPKIKSGNKEFDILDKLLSANMFLKESHTTRASIKFAPIKSDKYLDVSNTSAKAKF